MKESKGESQYLAFAINTARAAGRLILNFHKRRLEPIWTSPTHFMTEADKASDALIQKELFKKFPDHNIYSEESGLLEKKSRYTWVIDAVDGTINLRTSLTDHFAVCIALCQSTTPIIGVVYAPKRGELFTGGELFTAEIGKGAFCNDEAIHVSGLTDIHQVLMGVDPGKHNRTKHLPYLEKLFSPEGITCAMTTGCASVPLVLVAKGVLHAYLATSLEPEDMAAAVCIIREAGGKVTNLEGKKWQLGDVSILAANPELHEKLFQFLGL